MMSGGNHFIKVVGVLVPETRFELVASFVLSEGGLPIAYSGVNGGTEASINRPSPALRTF